MSDVEIILDPEPAALTRETVLAGLRAYNRQRAEAPNFEPLTIAAREDGGAVVGGLVGTTGWRWLYVDLLWVDEAHRGRGIGRKLLAAAEHEALRRGCAHVYLDTFEFQARGFYERLGFVVFGVQDDYPPGSRRYFMRKALVPESAAGSSV